MSDVNPHYPPETRPVITRGTPDPQTRIRYTVMHWEYRCHECGQWHPYHCPNDQ